MSFNNMPNNPYERKRPGEETYTPAAKRHADGHQNYYDAGYYENYHPQNQYQPPHFNHLPPNHSEAQLMENWNHRYDQNVNTALYNGYPNYYNFDQNNYGQQGTSNQVWAPQNTTHADPFDGMIIDSNSTPVFPRRETNTLNNVQTPANHSNKVHNSSVFYTPPSDDSGYMGTPTTSARPERQTQVNPQQTEMYMFPNQNGETSYHNHVPVANTFQPHISQQQNQMYEDSTNNVQYAPNNTIIGPHQMQNVHQGQSSIVPPHQLEKQNELDSTPNELNEQQEEHVLIHMRDPMHLPLPGTENYDKSVLFHKPHPKDHVIVETVDGRLPVVGDKTRFNLTVEELRRRVLGLETMNVSSIMQVFRKSKKKDGSADVRKKLEEWGLNIRPMLRKRPPTIFSFFLEEESLAFACELDQLYIEQFPVDELAWALIRKFVDEEITMKECKDMCACSFMVLHKIVTMYQEVQPKVVGLKEKRRGSRIDYAWNDISLLSHGFILPNNITNFNSISRVLVQAASFADEILEGKRSLPPVEEPIDGEKPFESMSDKAFEKYKMKQKGENQNGSKHPPDCVVLTKFPSEKDIFEIEEILNKNVKDLEILEQIDDDNNTEMSEELAQSVWNELMQNSSMRKKWQDFAENCNDNDKKENDEDGDNQEEEEEEMADEDQIEVFNVEKDTDDGSSKENPPFEILPDELERLTEIMLYGESDMEESDGEGEVDESVDNDQNEKGSSEDVGEKKLGNLRQGCSSSESAVRGSNLQKRRRVQRFAIKIRRNAGEFGVSAVCRRRTIRLPRRFSRKFPDKAMNDEDN